MAEIFAGRHALEQDAVALIGSATTSRPLVLRDHPSRERERLVPPLEHPREHDAPIGFRCLHGVLREEPEAIWYLRPILG